MTPATEIVVQEASARSRLLASAKKSAHGGAMAITFREVGESTHNASLRPVVAAIDRHLSYLSEGTGMKSGTGISQLLESWSELVRLLALGPAPEMRGCPVCGRGGLSAATRCGYCWTALPHRPAAVSVQAEDGSVDGA
jgi:hypothetical protein